MKSLIIIIFLLFTSPVFAKIGISEISFIDEIRNREIKLRVLYPVNDDEKTVTQAENPVFYGFNASEDARISKKNLPLYIIVHGTSGNWRNQSWLGNELAKNAVVISANHQGYTSGQTSPESVLKPQNQALDVSFMITKIIDSDYGKYINRDKIAVIGHSLGGYTALALLGARIDLQKYIEFCGKEQDDACRYFKNALGKLTKTDISKAKNSLLDARVKAGIAMAPGLVESMTEQSLKTLSAPALIIAAEFDTNVPPSTHYVNLPDNINYNLINDASHFSFLQLCKPKAIEILAEEEAEFVCKDGSGRNRKSIHNDIANKVMSFLKKHDM